MQSVGGGNPLKKIGREFGNAIGTVTGIRAQAKAARRQQEEAERQARAAVEEERRQAEEEAKRREEERARAEAEAKAKAEAEAKRIAEVEAQRKREEAYRKQVQADTTSMQTELDNLQRQQQGAGVLQKPQTTVDFSKSLKLGKETEEDKLKKVFKAR